MSLIEEKEEWIKNENMTTKRSKLSMEENEPFLTKVFKFDKTAESLNIHTDHNEVVLTKSRPIISLIKLIKNNTKQLLEGKDIPNEQVIAKLIKAMQEITVNRLNLKLILSSDIGLTVQRLYEFAYNNPLLKEIAIYSKDLIRFIKKAAYHELFGCDVKTKVMAVEGSDSKPIKLSVKRPVNARKEGVTILRRKAKEELKESMMKTRKLPSVIIVGEAMEKCETQEKLTDKEEEIPSRDIDLTKSIREKLYKELRKVFIGSNIGW